MDLTHLLKTDLKQINTEKLKTKRWKKMYQTSTYTKETYLE